MDFRALGTLARDQSLLPWHGVEHNDPKSPFQPKAFHGSVIVKNCVYEMLGVSCAIPTPSSRGRFFPPEWSHILAHGAAAKLQQELHSMHPIQAG